MQARVWNDNVHPHTERFKGKVITIPAKEFIPMDYDEAKEFEGQFTPIVTDGERNPKPESFKMIRVEKLMHGALTAVAGPQSLVCHFTGRVAANLAELERMNAEHVDQLEAGSRDLVEDNAKLRAELDSLKASFAAREDKKPVGRPKKEV